MNEADLPALIVFGGMFVIAVIGLILSSSAAERLGRRHQGHSGGATERPAPVRPPTR